MHGTGIAKMSMFPRLYNEGDHIMEGLMTYRHHLRYINRFWLMIIGFVLVFLIPLYAAETLTNFEHGDLGTSTGGYFSEYENDRTHGPDIQEVGIASNQGADGTSRCLYDTVTEGNIYLMYYADPERKVLIPQASGANRMSFYIKLPSGYPLSADYNFHVGTYTRDPVNGDLFQNGSHYYHYFNIPGTGNWTKIVCNQHPQHEVGVKVDPGDNPVSWGYYNGFTRFYLDMQPQSPIALPWTGHIDEVKFYSISEPENDETINSISCSYFGNGRFQIGWHGNSQYTHNNHRYEIRYSTSPITNANYSTALLVPGGPFRLAPGAYNFIKADFTITVNNGKRYYFAIKDIDSASSYVSKIDYWVGDQVSSSDTTPPAAPGGVGVQVN